MRARHRTVPAPDHALLGAFIRRLRLNAGFSQDEVTERLGFPQSFLSKVERGERQLQVVEFVLICRTLSLEPDEMLRTYLNELPAISALGDTRRVKRARPSQDK